MKTQRTIKILTVATLLVAVALTATAQIPEDVPYAAVVSPAAVTGQMESAAVSTSPTFRFVGNANDPAQSVTSYRVLFKRAILPDGNYADTRIDFDTNRYHLAAYDDPEWSEWNLWPGGQEFLEFSYEDLPQRDESDRVIQYLLAIQIMSSDGLVSAERRYGQDVVNFRVSPTVTPVLAVFHPTLGRTKGAGPNLQQAVDLLPGLDGLFTWEAESESYGGSLESYRWGWDLLDPDDPDDPNWAVPPGIGEQFQQAGPIPFETGIHTLTVQAVDNVGGLTRWVLTMTMVPIPDVSMQRPVLLVDDVRDQDSNAWHGEDGTPLDQDEYRDAFWLDVLAGPGGVVGFDAGEDVIDTEDQGLMLRDLVDYRAVVFTSRWVSAPNSAVSALFRPYGQHSGVIIPRYNWLASYQEQVGNVLYCSNRAADNFDPESPYVLPVVFESPQGSITGMGNIGGLDVRLGFGRDLATNEPIYPTIYGYRNLGLAALDITSPSAAYYTPRGDLLRIKRKNACAAMKGVVLDAAFVDAHMGGVPAFADTIWTEISIDWQDDPFPEDGDVLVVAYQWGNDEFYDVDVQARDIPFTIQDCDGQPCVEPLLRTVSRFDWVQAAYLAEDPDSTWPDGYYGGPGQPGLDDVCGFEGLQTDRQAAVTNDHPTAFVTHKFEDQKPSGVGDVVMGFDPYRFDHETMTDALRWVLGEHFGLALSP